MKPLSRVEQPTARLVERAKWMLYAPKPAGTVWPGHAEELARDVLSLAAALRAAEEALWECYKLSGADTDGDKKFHCSLDAAARQTVAAVKELRDDYDEACSEVAHVDISIEAREQALLRDIQDVLEAPARPINALMEIAEKVRAALAVLGSVGVGDKG